MYQIISSVVALVLILKLSKILRIAYDPDLRKIPGPWLSRFTNIQLKLQVLSGRRTKYIHSLHQTYGPIVRIAPEELGIADIKAFREIHKIGTSFIKGPWYQQQSPVQYDDETCGVFGLRDPKKATARRRLFQQAGTKAAVLQWEPFVVDIVRRTVQKIKRDAENGVADVEKWWALMTADVLGSLAFGEPFGMIEKEEKPQMIKDIEMSMIFAGVRSELPWLWNIVSNIPLPKIGRPQAMFQRFDQYGETAVRNTKAAPKGSAKTLFSKMVPEEGEQPLTDLVIAQESANIIIAGSDTTAVVLSYLVYSVLKDAGIKEKLLEELRTCPASPSWDELERLPYLGRVIQETLRLYAPVTASLPRTAPVGGMFLGGYRVPAGITCDTQAYTFHRDPKVWEEPERFHPDRWIEPTAQMKEFFMPFGGSARVCLGQNVARLELLQAVAMFFKELPNARLAESVSEKSMETFDFFVIKPVGGKLEITAK